MIFSSKAALFVCMTGEPLRGMAERSCSRSILGMEANEP
jgi:hypothetical protein